MWRGSFTRGRNPRPQSNLLVLEPLWHVVGVPLAGPCRFAPLQEISVRQSSPVLVRREAVCAVVFVGHSHPSSILIERARVDFLGDPMTLVSAPKASPIVHSELAAVDDFG